MAIERWGWRLGSFPYDKYLLSNLQLLILIIDIPGTTCNHSETSCIAFSLLLANVSNEVSVDYFHAVLFRQVLC